MSKEGLAALQLAVDEVKSVISTLTDEEWARPSGCQGWSVRDLVAHMSSNYKETVDPSPAPAEPINLPVYWGADQFVLAAAFAVGSAVIAAWLPARKGGRVQPVDILRGAA